MKIPTWRFGLILVPLVLGGFAACDEAGSEHALIGPSLPVFEESEEDGGGDGELVEEEAYSGATAAAAWIGSAGGSISLAGHSLTVPEGAVSQHLCFTMELGTSTVVDVDLNAWQMESSEGCKVEGNAEEVEAGEGSSRVLWTGTFDVPVSLALTYSRALDVSDPTELVVAWLKSATETLPVSSSVDTASETVRGELNHFSEYALFIP